MSRLVFVNCHLASDASFGLIGPELLGYRSDHQQNRLRSVVHAGVSEVEGEKIGDKDFAFWFGDLNFRLDSLSGDNSRRIPILHARSVHGLSNERQGTTIYRW
ncbi:hypothetical protein E4U13_005990 [Claviceps humidiphila]|uniref:Inositol polyphosphate-related phosphatase domain-containing protein n=1 Tax=Claviceps humidiphila TaxID=1294629 RepID=A0A9P7Q9W7_9HYPO|nr:hypothetical protein E4U13_005990 [Claviceps humidiphila]